MCHWLSGRVVPDYFTLCTVVRWVREGRQPSDADPVNRSEFGAMVRRWRAKHGLSRRQAGVALGLNGDVLRGWESGSTAPRDLARVELVRRMRLPLDVELVKQATRRPPPIEPAKFAELFRAWRRRTRLTQNDAAYALRTATGRRTTPRTIWVWEKREILPQNARAILDLIHGELAVNPPKLPRPKPPIPARQFATMLRQWRRTYCLTQMQACVALGLPRDQALISKWESCKAFPKGPRLQRISAALKQPPATGFGDAQLVQSPLA